MKCYAACLLLSLTLVTCGGFNIQSPLSAAKPDQLLELAMKTGGKVAEKAPECQALGDIKRITGEDPGSGTISFPEERALGGAAIIAYAAKFGGLRIDLPSQLQNLSTSELSSKLSDRNLEEAEKTSLPKTGNNRLHQNLATIGWHLAKLSDRESIPWTFCVINNDGINAYSSPGGYVCVTEGLLKSLNNEAELACVLAHEIGHVVKKHGPVEYGQIKKSQCLAMLTQDVAGDLVKVDVKFGNYFDINSASKELVQKLVDAFVEKMVSVGFGRETEYEADAYMYDLVAQAGYDRTACQAFLNRLPQSGVFSNHPSPSDRVQKLVELEAQNKDSFGYLTQGQVPSWSLEQARLKI